MKIEEMKLFSKLKPAFSYLYQSVSTKVFIVIIALVLPLNIFAIMLSEMAVRNVTEQTRISVSNIMHNHITSMESRMEYTTALLYSMKNNDKDAIILSKQQGDNDYYMAKYRFFNTIRTTLTVSDAADGTFMYMGEVDDLLLLNMDTRIHTINDMDNYIRKMIGENISKGWHIEMVPGKYADDLGNPVLWLITEMNGIYTGGWIEMDSISSKLRADLQYKNVEIFFTKTPEFPVNKNTILITDYSHKADMYITVQLEQREINGGILSGYLLLRWIAIIALILLPNLYFLLYFLMIRPLKRLNKAHMAIEGGDADYRIQEKGSSIEYQQAYESFNHMAEHLKNLKIENYEKELEKQQAVMEKQQVELKNLQLQIRPHFLINAFNLIYTLAQDKESEHIQQIMLYLSDYFRYIFRSDRSLELFGKELKLIEGYINMAQIRYPGSIEIVYDFSPEIAYVRIPPLLLHNFIENIIKHVVNQGTVTHIFMKGTYANGKVAFLVKDDGPGMAPEKLAEVMKKMRQKEITGTSVGLANAYRRLKYFYGEDADICISSEMGEGTAVEVVFYCNLDQEK